MAFSGWQKEARVDIEFGPWQPNELETLFCYQYHIRSRLSEINEKIQ